MNSISMKAPLHLCLLLRGLFLRCTFTSPDANVAVLVLLLPRKRKKRKKSPKKRKKNQAQAAETRNARNPFLTMSRPPYSAFPLVSCLLLRFVVWNRSGAFGSLDEKDVSSASASTPSKAQQSTPKSDGPPVCCDASSLTSLEFLILWCRAVLLLQSLSGMVSPKTGAKGQLLNPIGCGGLRIGTLL